MIIGNFTYDSAHDSYSGDIRTLTFERTRLLVRPHQKSAEKEPDYRLFHVVNGEEVEIGAAWKRRSERGQDFLSIVLDDPALSAPINAALFLRDHDNTANLVWTRPSAKPKAPSPAAERPAPSSSRRARRAPGTQPV